MLEEYWNWLENREKIYGLGNEGSAQSFGAIVWVAAQNAARESDRKRAASTNKANGGSEAEAQIAEEIKSRLDNDTIYDNAQWRRIVDRWYRQLHHS